MTMGQDNNNKDDLMKLVLNKLDKIEDKIERKFDGVEVRLDSVDKTLVKQEENLKEHMKRSDLLEQSQGDLEKAIKPILNIYTVAWGITKIVGAIGIIISILLSILKLK